MVENMKNKISMGKSKLKFSKKHSVLYLASMQTTRLLLVILVLMTVAEIAVFYGTSVKMSGYTLTDVFDASKVYWISRVGCFLYCLAMIFTKINRHGSAPVYTFARLNESRIQQRVENYIYNLLCVLVLWGTLVLAYFGMYLIYTKTSDISVIGKHTWALTIYHVSFLKSFMPVCSLKGWILLAIIFLGMPLLISEAIRYPSRYSLFIAMFYLIYVLLLPDSFVGDIWSEFPLVFFVLILFSHNLTLDRNVENKEKDGEKGGYIETSVSIRR